MPIQQPQPKIVLAVIDGWGVAPPWGGNAISLAQTKFFNEARTKYPYCDLAASGVAVGLPFGEKGNSEVGHLNIGAGQVVHEALPAITDSIKDGSFFKNEFLIKAFSRAKAKNKAVHILGLASDGGIHSHINHLFALLEMARQQESTNVCIHVITDGRDSPPFEAEEYCGKITAKLNTLGFGKICTVSGRYYAMDRDHRWERIEKEYRAITEGVGQVSQSAQGAVAQAYRDGFSDEFVVPTVIHGENNAFQTLQDGDSVIFYNFRGDRAREISQAITKPDFKDFDRKKFVNDLYFVGFTFYQEGLPIEVAFRPRNVQFPISRVLSESNLTQLHVAESEKYAHVTYFFNAGREEPYKNEDRMVIPSPKAASFDQVPTMSTSTITETVISRLSNYDFTVLNYASPDMVGHTGNLRAAITACEAVDNGLEAIAKKVLEIGGIFIITADHGNAEQMVNPKTGEPDTEHTANPVPFLIINDSFIGMQLRQNGKLSDVAPTILQIMNLPQPEEMTGQSLLIPKAVSTNPASPVTTTATG